MTTRAATSDLDAIAQPAAELAGRDGDFDEAPLNLHLQQLAYVRALERWGTLTEAARRLQVSQPALSQSLSQLERRLGVSLLERDGRRRQLTEAGREVARFAGETLARAGALRDWLDDYAEGRAGTLRVGMIDAASLYALPSAIRAFRDTHPEVQLELVVDRTGLLLERLARFELDLAFVVGPAPPEFDATEVLSEPLYLYAPPGAIEDPAAGEWVLYPPGRQTRRIIDAGLAARGIWPRISLESDNPAVLGQMVALGLGWSVLPEGVVEGVAPELAASRREQIAERTLLAARRSQSPPDTRAGAFLRLVMDVEGTA
ncbi:MAG: LysR family transcriptional regulator [Chloroflexi bacterium]|nr:LysR family transcriptional regulator [Chloroflexota bacterium]